MDRLIDKRKEEEKRNLVLSKENINYVNWVKFNGFIEQLPISKLKTGYS